MSPAAKAARLILLMGLLDGDLPAGRSLGGLLGHLQLQNAAFVAGGDLVGPDAGDIEAPAVSAVGALAADVLVFLLGILVLGVTLRLDSQGVAVQIQVDIDDVSSADAKGYFSDGNISSKPA